MVCAGNSDNVSLLYGAEVVEMQKTRKNLLGAPLMQIWCDNTDAVRKWNDVREGCCYVTASSAERRGGAEK